MIELNSSKFHESFFLVHQSPYHKSKPIIRCLLQRSFLSCVLYANVRSSSIKADRRGCYATKVNAKQGDEKELEAKKGAHKQGKAGEFESSRERETLREGPWVQTPTSNLRGRSFPAYIYT